VDNRNPQDQETRNRVLTASVVLYRKLLSLFPVPCVLYLSITFAFMKILMVCLGNICRSPLAEGILQDKALKAGLTWSVESAGTNGYQIGEPPHPLSQKVARMNGIDISQQRVRRFIAEDFEVYDKIYALAEDVIENMRLIAKNKFDASKADLLMNELYPGKNMDVPDPYYGSETGYHKAYKMIDEACNVLISKYANVQMMTT
jgi:low molecular weight protein-tyrosine phosphatase